MTEDGPGHARNINLIIKLGICHSTSREGMRENELDLTVLIQSAIPTVKLRTLKPRGTSQGGSTLHAVAYQYAAARHILTRLGKDPPKPTQMSSFC